MTGDFYHDKYGNPLSMTGQHLTDAVSPALYVAVIEKAQKERDLQRARAERLRLELEKIAWLDEFLDADGAKAMMQIARDAVNADEAD